MFIRFATKEISFKVVYYGAGLSGKTATVRGLYSRLKCRKGEFIELSADGSRTLYFDFFPASFGVERGGYTISFSIYTVPGHVLYRSMRRIILKGADGVVFVADASPERMDANLIALEELQEDLSYHGLRGVPIVFQVNKLDLKGALSFSTVIRRLSIPPASSFPSSALKGRGIVEPFKALSSALIRDLPFKARQPVSA
jgi:signal recognition particle receptor subunit beta